MLPEAIAAMAVVHWKHHAGLEARLNASSAYREGHPYSASASIAMAQVYSDFYHVASVFGLQEDSHKKVRCSFFSPCAMQPLKPYSCQFSQSLTLCCFG
jgi:hypothetical protein